MFRFYDVSSGSILVNGKDVRDITQVSLRKNIGVVPQDTVLFNDTIYYNLSYGKINADEKEIWEVARRAQLSELNKTLPDGMSAEVDERGLKIASQGRKMIIPKELQFTAERLMKSPMRVGTADNDINAVRSMGMVPEGYVVNNFLTDTDSYFLMTDVPNGFKYFVRSPIKTAMEGDFDTGNVRFKARERYSFGFSDPRCIFGNGNLPTS